MLANKNLEQSSVFLLKQNRWNAQMQNRRKYHTVRSEGSKCWNMFKRFQKYVGIKFIQILRARTNSQVSDLQSDLYRACQTKQLQRLRDYDKSHFLVRKSATGIGKKITTASRCIKHPLWAIHEAKALHTTAYCLYGRPTVFFPACVKTLHWILPSFPSRDRAWNNHAHQIHCWSLVWTSNQLTWQ